MEVDKPLPTYGALELEQSFSVFLELPESDSFFDKKKNLLQKKGFNTKELCLLRSSHPDLIRTSLKIMLQIARIINLDEVELYFSEDDASLTVDFYSPRNEIVSLNSILRLVENSLDGHTQMQKNILEELRNVISDMIANCSDKNNVKSVIVEDHCCDKESCLLQWGEANGTRSRLGIAYVEGAGRGAIAREDLKVGDTALEIPASLIISEELVKKSDMFHILEKRSEMSSETILLLWSMKEKHNNNSKFKVYFDTLPEEFNTGLSFGFEALMVLDETVLFEEIMQAKEHLQAQYEQLVPPLFNEHPDIFPPELYTWEKFLWACELWYSNSMKIMFPDGELRTCLVPIASFLNHSLYPHVTSYGKVDSTTNTLKFCLSRPCSSGEECFLSYGNFSSSHLITFYGFVPKGDNPDDVIPLELEGDEGDSEDDSCISSITTHMVRGTWFSKNHNIFHYGLPSTLLDYLRRAHNPMLQTKTLLQESLENEMEILEQLRLIFDDMMDKLGDVDLEDRENTRWDVKLAIEFKDIQRRIVSSILTSCHSGLDLVKDNLCMCMAEDTRG
ncbi:Rubisco LSMT methyltransferase [Trema orientale]|uniref:Rubisco LSMT methyltransferase n=1 Tax=Trema orientale TaxID=63057 RepID=A0A2P5FJF6_TREOI|nr:Rubisco LSMT methyltransferase [Trema orientale]